MTVSAKVYAACSHAVSWRDRRIGWPALVRKLADMGFYAITDDGEDQVIAYLNGVRFSL